MLVVRPMRSLTSGCACCQEHDVADDWVCLLLLAGGSAVPDVVFILCRPEVQSC